MKFLGKERCGMISMRYKKLFIFLFLISAQLSVNGMSGTKELQQKLDTLKGQLTELKGKLTELQGKLGALHDRLTGVPGKPTMYEQIIRAGTKLKHIDEAQKPKAKSLLQGILSKAIAEVKPEDRLEKIGEKGQAGTSEPEEAIELLSEYHSEVSLSLWIKAFIKATNLDGFNSWLEDSGSDGDNETMYLRSRNIKEVSDFIELHKAAIDAASKKSEELQKIIEKLKNYETTNKEMIEAGAKVVETKKAEATAALKAKAAVPISEKEGIQKVLEPVRTLIVPGLVNVVITDHTTGSKITSRENDPAFKDFTMEYYCGKALNNMLKEIQTSISSVSNKAEVDAINIKIVKLKELFEVIKNVQEQIPDRGKPLIQAFFDAWDKAYAALKKTGAAAAAASDVEKPEPKGSRKLPEIPVKEDLQSIISALDKAVQNFKQSIAEDKGKMTEKTLENLNAFEKQVDKALVEWKGEKTVEDLKDFITKFIQTLPKSKKTEYSEAFKAIKDFKNAIRSTVGIPRKTKKKSHHVGKKARAEDLKNWSNAAKPIPDMAEDVLKEALKALLPEELGRIKGMAKNRSEMSAKKQPYEEALLKIIAEYKGSKT